MAETFTIRFEDASSTGGGTGGGGTGGGRGAGGGAGGGSNADLIGADPAAPRAGATGPIGDDKWFKHVAMMQYMTMNRIREALEIPTLEEDEGDAPVETTRDIITPGQMAALAGAASSGNLGALGGVGGSIIGNIVAPGVGGPIGGLVGGLAGNIAQETPIGTVAEVGSGSIIEGLNAVINPVGTALDKLSSGLSRAADVASVFVSLDTRKFEQSAMEMVSNVPLIGTAYARIGQSFTGLLDTIEGTAQRLSGFSPDLAVSFAMQDVRTTLRDLDRAERLGPKLAAVQEARYQIENKIADILTALAPPILSAVETILTKIDESLQMWAGFTDLWLMFVNKVVDWINTLQWMGGAAIPHVTLPDMLREIVEAVRRGPDRDIDGRMAEIMNQITNQGVNPGREDRNDGPVANQALAPVFGGF